MMKIAVAQIGSVKGKAAENARDVVRWIEQAAGEGIVLAVFPECCLTGYVYESRPDLEAAAISASGAEIARIEAACRAASMHVVVGLFEAEGARVYNTALLIGPEGVIGRHRKRHLPFLGGDRFVDQPDGIEPAVFDTPVGKIGLAICYEIRFPEVVRTLVLSGAEIVVLPTNWPVASRILADLFTPVRAAENFVYFLAANRNDSEDGTDFLGSSQIVDPVGKVIAHAGTATGLFAAEVDLERARNKTIVFESGAFEIAPFKDRKPETYRI
jgi:predicted amidohydrolase